MAAFAKASGRTIATACVGLLLTVCGGGTASPTVAPTHSATAAIPDLPGGCRQRDPCTFDAGTYVTAKSSVLWGIVLTLPGGWSSTENDKGELNLVAPGHPDELIFIWVDVAAVKSSGTGHGTPLTNIGTTSQALVAWLTTNPDVLVVSAPVAATIANGINTTSVVVGVSQTAQFGDPGCPANPRCADLFTRPMWDSAYGIGGAEEAHVYVADITIEQAVAEQQGLAGTAHTLLVVLDAPTHAQLETLTAVAQPILDSLRLTRGVVAR